MQKFIDIKLWILQFFAPFCLSQSCTIIIAQHEVQKGLHIRHAVLPQLQRLHQSQAAAAVPVLLQLPARVAK